MRSEKGIRMIRRSLRLISTIVLAFFMFSLCAPIVEAANSNRNYSGGNNRSNPSLQQKRLLQQQQLKAQLEATRRKALEAQRRQAEAKRKAQLEAQKKAKLEAQKKAQVEAQKKAQIEAQKKAAAQAKAKAEHQAKLAAQKQAKAQADAVKKAQAQQAKIAADKARAQLLVKHPKANAVIDLNKIKAQSLANMYDIDLGTAKKILASKPSKGFKSVQDFINVRDRVIKAAGPQTVNVRGPKGTVDINKPANLLIKDLAKAGFSNADANAILQLRGRGTFKSFADLKAQLTRAGYKGPINGHKPAPQPKVETKITKATNQTQSPKAPSLKTSRGPAPSTPQGYYNAIKGANSAPEVYQRLVSKGVPETLAKEIAKAQIKLHRGFTSANDMAANVDSLKGTKAGQAGIKSAQLKQVRSEISKWNSQLEQISKIKPQSELGYNNQIKLLQEVRGKLAKQLIAEAKLKGDANPTKSVSQDARYRKVVDRIQNIEKVKVVEGRKAQVAKEMHTLNNRLSNMHKGNKPTTQQGLQTRIKNLNNVYGEMFGRVAEEMHLSGKKVTKDAVTNDPRLKKIQQELQSTRKAFTERRVADGKVAEQARQAKELKQYKARAEKMHQEALKKAKAEQAQQQKVAKSENKQQKVNNQKTNNQQKVNNQKTSPKASQTTENTSTAKKLSVEQLYGKVKNSKSFSETYQQLRKAGVEKGLAHEIAKARRAGTFKSAQDMAGRVKSLNDTPQGKQAIEQIKARSEKALSRAKNYNENMQKVKANRPAMEHVTEGLRYGKPKVSSPELTNLDAANKHYGQVRGRMQQVINDIKAENPGQFKNSRQIIKMARRSNLKTGKMAELKALSDEYLRTKNIRTKLVQEAKLQPQTKSKASDTAQKQTNTKSNTQANQTYNFKNFRSTNVRELSQANSKLTQQAMAKHGFKNASELKAALNKGGRLPQDLYQLKQVRGRISELAKGSSTGSQQAKATNEAPSAPKSSTKASNTQPASDYSYKNFRSTNVRELSQANSKLTQQAMAKHGFKNATELKAALNKSGRLPQDLYQLKQVRGRISELAKGSSSTGSQQAKASNEAPAAPKTSSKASNTGTLNFDLKSSNVSDLGRANTKLTQQAMAKHGFNNAGELKAALNKGGRLPQDLYQLKQVRGRISELSKGSSNGGQQYAKATNEAPQAPKSSTKASNTQPLEFDIKTTNVKELGRANTKLTQQAMKNHGFNSAQELKTALKGSELPKDLAQLKEVRGRISEVGKANAQASTKGSSTNNSGTTPKASNTSEGSAAAEAAPKKGGFFDFLFNKNAKGGPDILGKHGKVDGKASAGKHIDNFIEMFDSKKMLNSEGAKKIDISAKAKANADANATWGKNLLESWTKYNKDAAKGWDIMKGHRAADAKAASAKGAWWDVFGQNKATPKAPSGSESGAKAPLEFALEGDLSAKGSESFKAGKSVEAVTEQINQTKSVRADLFKKLQGSNPELTGKDIYQKSLSKDASGDFLKLRELDGKVHDLRAHRTNLKGMVEAETSSAKAPTETAKVDGKSTKPAATKSSGSIWENLFGKKGISQFFKGRGGSTEIADSVTNKGKANTGNSSSSSNSSSSGKGSSNSSSSSQAKSPTNVAEPLPNAGKIQTLDGRITQLRADSNALAKSMVNNGQYKSLYDVVKASRDPGATGELARLNNMRTELKTLRTERLGLAKDSTTQTNTKANTQISEAVKSAQSNSTVPTEIAQAQAKVQALQGQLKASAADAVAQGKFSSVEQALKSPEFRGKAAELNSMEQALKAKATEAAKPGAPKTEGAVKENHVAKAIEKGKGTETAKGSETKTTDSKASETAKQGETTKASQTADVPPAMKVAEAKATQLRAQIQQLEAGKGGLLSRFTKGRQLTKAKAELAKVEQDIAKMKQDPNYLAQKNSELKIDPKSAQGKLISAIDAELAKPNLDPKYKAELMKRKASLESTPSQSFVKQGLQIVAISAATNILFNVYRQLKEDGKIDWGKATEFITNKQFWMSTGGVAVGAYLGGKVAMMPFMYLLTSRVAAITPFGGLVMSLLPAFLGGAIGGQLMGGGFQNIDWLMLIGQTLGSVLGTALAMTFFPGLGMIGNLAGAMIGGFIAEKIIEMIRGPQSEASERGDGDTASSGDVEQLPSTKGSGTFTEGDVSQAFANMKSSYQAYLEAEKAGNYGQAAEYYQSYIGYKRTLDGMRQTSFSAAQ